MINHFLRFWKSSRCVILLGLIVTLVATSLEVFKGRATNYYDYADSTIMFWNGVIPYTMQFYQVHHLFFLYTPVFNVVFAPIFLLPWWLGPYVWNIMNYSLLVTAIWTLPERFKPYRHNILLFLLSIILQSVFCFQYNVVVCYIFLFAFTLMEKGKVLWAIVLIMLSATTKIYGIAELGLLMCYSFNKDGKFAFGKYFGYMAFALLIGIVYLLLPLMNTAFQNPLELYNEMGNNLMNHHDNADYIGILFAVGLKPFLLPNMRLVQIGVLAILAMLFFWRFKRWQDPFFRTCSLAIITGYIILFSDSPETHTYIIPISAYLMVYWTMPRRGIIDKILFWILFVNFCILPTDVLCPAWIHNWIHMNLWLDVYIYTVIWFFILWRAVVPSNYKPSWGQNTLIISALIAFSSISYPTEASAQCPCKNITLKVGNTSYKMIYVQGNNEIEDFYIGETEVTQELWESIMHKNRSKHRSPKFAVENIPWVDMQKFISKLNEQSGYKFRLPAEAEWEYAAKGGKYSQGYTYSGSNDINEVAWYSENAGWDEPSHEVGILKPNELGLYDMSGNVWELCQDTFTHTNETGLHTMPEYIVMKGGTWHSFAEYCTPENRFPYNIRRKIDLVGFRLVLSVK